MNYLNLLIKVLFEKNRNVYLSGIGGCGKSYLANQIKNYCKENGIICALTSTTGVSAYNIKGQTIHSWCGIVFSKATEDNVERIVKRILRRAKDRKKIQNTQLLIVDEVSMLGGTYLEVMDYIFKAVRQSKEPLGGLRVLFTGDFLQLPPVNDVYAFQSVVWNELNLATFELTIPKRFDDISYAEMLFRIRRGEHTEDDLEKLRERHKLFKQLKQEELDNCIYLFSKKKESNDFNKMKLDSIKGMPDIFVAEDMVIKCDDVADLTLLNINDYEVVDNADMENFSKCFIALKNLYLKPGCKIMVINNISQEEGIVNGARGTFIGTQKSISPITNAEVTLLRVKLDNGTETLLDKVLFSHQEGDEALVRIQYPVILSYGITAHKAQGLTLDKVVLNLGREIFEAGQAYVALSRCRNLNTVYISNFVEGKLYCDNICKKFENGLKKYKLN